MQQHTVQTAAPRRLADYLPGVFPALTSGKVYRFAKEKKIRCNGAHVDGTHKVENGDILSLYLPDELLGAAAGPLFARARDELAIVFENEDLLVADKPSGLPVEDETGALPDTLINRALKALAGRGVWQPGSGFTPCLCHRLDTGTSGLVLIAKTARCRDALTEAIRQHQLKKIYLCATFGRPVPPAATLHAFLSKDAAHGQVYLSERARPGSREIVTGYRTLAVSGRLALLQIELVTGRTHQIRAQMAAIGCPVLGDSKYGNHAANREFHLRYQLLTAYKITLPSFDGTPLAALSQRTFTAAKPWYFAPLTGGEMK